MSDVELLELAAKAAGLKCAVVYEACPEEGFSAPYAKLGKHEHWCPITDDGDAFGLAVELGLLIGAGGDEAWAQFYRLETAWSTFKEPRGDDMKAAMRRVIVRAAAEIGRTMP